MCSRLSGFELQPVRASRGNGPAPTFRIQGARGTIGFISPLGEHFCGASNRLRLTSDGKLRSFLVSPHEISLRETVRNGKPLDEYFIQAVQDKPQHHYMLATKPADARRGMSQIGG